jgi:beta-xylosidase
MQTPMKICELPLIAIWEPIKNNKNLHMKSSYLFLFFLILILESCAEKKDKISFDNPLDVKFGDPFVLKSSDGKYYMYGTGGGAKKGFAAYSSSDLKNWKSEGQVYYSDNKNGWGVNSFWAPEVYEREGKYYMFYSAQWKVNPTNEKENFKIGVAVADSPLGPFEDIKSEPIFNPEYPIIDANVYFEDDKAYLYFSRCCYKHPVESEISRWANQKEWYDEIEESWIYGIELKPDFTGVKGEPKLLLRPPLEMNNPNTEWESRSVTAQEANRRWTEGSTLLKHEGIYYMMYSANNFDGENYAVGYATSHSPLGDYKKAKNNPVLEKNGKVTGTGHNSIIESPNGDGWICFYHGRTNKTGHKRLVFMDKMNIDDEGVLSVEGPTLSETSKIKEK